MSGGATDAAAVPPLHPLQAAIAALELQRALLGDAVVDMAVAGLQAQWRLQQAAAADVDAGPAQALRLVSILFLDVVGSTSLGQRLDPEEIHAVMDGALAGFAAIVGAHGGRVLQFAGDNLLAGFGADEVHEDDAERAVRCGLALLADGRRVGQQVQARYGHAGFDVRVGIHSGGVLLGGGVDAEGTIRGNAVNIAARMEQSAPAGALRISVDTYRLVQGRFDVQAGQALAVKGIDAPVHTYLVERARARGALAVPRGFNGATAALVGRDADLAQMRAALAAVQAARTLQGVLLIGDAGLGKTRLVAEFEAGLAAPGPAPAVLRGCAQPQGLNQPYGVIRDLLFRRLDVQDSDPLAVAQAKLAAGLAPLFGARADEQTALLGQLIGLDYRTSPFVAGILDDGKQLRARAFHAFVEYLRLLCAPLAPDAALVLVLDDLHWADDGSLDAVAHLTRAGRDLPVLLLCAARPEFLQQRPGFDLAWPAQRRLLLQPLNADDRHTLARSLLQPLGPHREAPLLYSLLVERTDGIPFFMEALLQMLVDQGVLVTTTTPWQLAAEGLQRLQVPATLVGVLQARLDALQVPQRRALQQASVVGAVFWDDALAAIDHRAPAALPALLQRALALPSEQSAFGDVREYTFRHHLLHEVTYGTVLKRSKQEQHRLAALWLQARSQGRGAEFASQIAEHLDRAGMPEQAAEHWAQAAQEAVTCHADAAALAHADRALAAAAGKDAHYRFAMLRVRANVWSRRAQVNEHLLAIAAMEDMAEALDDDVLRLIAAHNRMHRLCLSGDYEKAHVLGVARLAAAEALAPSEAAKVHNMLIMALGRQGRIAEARAHAHAALIQARAAGDVYTEASVHNNLGVGYLAERRLALAQASCGQALAAYRRIGSRYGEAIARLNLAFATELSGQFQATRDQLLELLSLTDAIGHVTIGAQARCNLAGILVELGSPLQGLAHAHEGLRMAEGIADRFVETTGHGSAFQAHWALAQWRQAIDHGRLAQAGFAGNGQPADALAFEAGVACALHMAGDEDAAAAALQALLAAVAARGGWQDDETEAALYCHRLLAWRQDAGAAAALAAAHQGLMAQAAAFADPAERDCFLHATATRRETLAAWPGQDSTGP